MQVNVVDSPAAVGRTAATKITHVIRGRTPPLGLN